MKNLRKHLHVALDTTNKDKLSWINKLFILLIVGSIITVVLETEPSIMNGNEGLFFKLNVFFAIVFTLEYVIRLWVIGEDKRYQGFYGRIRYMCTPLALIDLFALLSFYTAFMTNSFVLRTFRFIRMISLAKLGRYTEAFDQVMNALYKYRYEMGVSIGVSFLVMLLASTGLYIIEGDDQSEAFGSIPRAMWWGLATLTTIGYGDVFPITWQGKIFAGMFALMGIGLIALPAGIMAAAFSEAVKVDKDGQYPTDRDYANFEEAFLEGKKAYLDGKLIDSNPHDISALAISKFNGWVDGWYNTKESNQ